jgi:hypothetical protein
MGSRCAANPSYVLAEANAYKSGMVELCYEVKTHCGDSRNATLQQHAADGAARRS